MVDCWFIWKGYKQKIQMIGKTVSSGQLGVPVPQVQNEQAKARQSEVDSLKQSICTSLSASAPRGRSITRKPADKQNLESYKLMKRKSQESKDSHSQDKKLEQPPKSPKNLCELNSESRATEPTLANKEGSTEALSSDLRVSGDVGKFKKKAMTKQEIVEIKQYMQTWQCESAETDSIAASEKATADTPFREREFPKKSKTQYFNAHEIRGVQVGEQLSENASQSEKMLMASLTQKCRSVDETNVLLNKRLNWLREEIEVHLQRQSEYQRNQSHLQNKVTQQAALITTQQQQIAQLQSLLLSKEQQLEKMRTLVIDLNLKFEQDRQGLISEIELLKSQHWEQTEEREERHQTKVRELEEVVSRLNRQLQQTPPREYQEEHSQGIVEKLLSENKYLKMQNHMLGRYKDKAEQLKKENKQISNERDTLKKKIIENLRKTYKSQPVQDSSDFSSLLSLSITHPS